MKRNSETRPSRPGTKPVAKRARVSIASVSRALSGHPHLNSGVLSRVIGGWTTSVISTIQSGGPFTVVTNQNTTNAFSAGAQRANVIRGANLPASERTVYRWLDTDAFVAPPPNTFGNAGRGIVRADGRVNFDLSLNKRFAITERLNARFTGELFNAFNHPDFAPPNRQLGNAAFGTISDAVDGRVVQLGLNLEF